MSSSSASANTPPDLSNPLGAHAFTHLVKVLVGSSFYGKKDDDPLELFVDSGMEASQADALISTLVAFLRQLASQDAQQADVETQLGQSGLDEEQTEGFLRVWRNESSKIHAAVRDASTFNNHLQQMSWRVDVQSRSNHLEDMNKACAIVEMFLAKRPNHASEVAGDDSKEREGGEDGDTGDNDDDNTQGGNNNNNNSNNNNNTQDSNTLQAQDTVLRFEMDAIDVTSMLQDLKRIQAAIDANQ